MILSKAILVSLVCAQLLQAFGAPAAAALSRLDVRAGYDSDPGDVSDKDGGDAWVALTAGKTMISDGAGPLAISLDLALGVTGYARLTELDRVSLVVTPAIEYVISPRVAASVALVTEGQIVSDGSRSAWGWGGALRLREQLSPRVSLAEYVSYRDLNAQGAEFSGTRLALGLYLRSFLGERWTLGCGGEYAHGVFLSDGMMAGEPVGLGKGSHPSQNYGEMLIGENEQTLAAQVEDRWSGSLALDYAWSQRVSSGAEYVYTRVSGESGDENQHAVIVSTTFGF